MDSDELRELAEEATPGPWKAAIPRAKSESSQVGVVGTDKAIAVFGGVTNRRNDAAFVGACDPSTVLALLDELEAKDRVIAAQEREIAALDSWIAADE